MSIRFGTTPSCCRKVATVFNEGLPKNDRKSLDFDPNGGGNLLRSTHVRTDSSVNKNTDGEVTAKDKKGQYKVVLWVNIKYNPPEELKVSPIAMIPHKYYLF